MKSKTPDKFKYCTQLVVWNAKGETEAANIIIEDNFEGLHILELLMELRDTDNYRYQLNPI